MRSPSKIRLSRITVSKGKGSVQKRIIADENGAPVKDPNHKQTISGGTVEEIAVSGLTELAEVISGLYSNQALTLGITGSGKRKLTTKNNLSKSLLISNPDYVARTTEYFRWPEEYFLLLLDYDPEPGQVPLSPQEFWESFCSIFPEFKEAGRLVTFSTSSAIYDKHSGECLVQATGRHHSFIVGRGDVDRFRQRLEHRCWLHNKAFFKLANPNKQTGVSAILERFLIDTSVLSPERVIYEAGACFEPDSPFEQRRPYPQVVEGEAVDLDLIADLTPEEKHQAEVNRQFARQQIEQLQEEQTIQAVKKANPGLNDQTAKNMARSHIRHLEKGYLPPKHLLYLEDGTTIKVEDIGSKHDGLQLRDPQEPDYQGGAIKAKIFWNDGNPYINSFAHGGKTYRLMSKNLEKTDKFTESLSSTSEIWTSDQVKQKLEQLVSEGLDQPDADFELIKLAKISRISPAMLRNLYQQLLERAEYQELAKEASAEFGELATASEAAFSIDSLLPTLAPALERYAEAFNQEPIAFLIPLLAVAASLISPETYLLIGGATNYKLPPIFWGGLVSPPGTIKSPIFAAIVTALILLQVDAQIAYDQCLEIYQNAMKDYKLLKGESAAAAEEPKEPLLKQYYVDSSTTEAVQQIVTRQTNKGLVVVVDELSGHFNSRNQYKSGGKGNDGDFWKSAADGGSVKIDRASAPTRFAAKTSISVTGTIQPEVLQEFMKKGDPDGTWSRFFWVRLPLRRIPPPGVGPKIDLNNLLHSTYQNLEGLCQTFTLSYEAKNTWIKWHEWTEDRRLGNNISVERVLYAKSYW